MGISPDEFLQRVDRVNLFPFPNTTSSGRRAVADMAAANLRPILRGRRVVLLGKEVTDAVCPYAGGLSPLVWRMSPDEFVWATLPHPSGLNRWWNLPQNQEDGREFCQTLLDPCIHVEGPDGSGKSTLVQWMVRNRPSLFLAPTEGPRGSLTACFQSISQRLDPGMVCDRSSGLVSELVYGPVLRGGVADGGEESLWSAARALRHAVVFVYCRPPRNTIADSHKPRKGEDPAHLRKVKDQAQQLIDRYDYVMAQLSRMGCRVIRYDWTVQKPEDILACVE